MERSFSAEMTQVSKKPPNPDVLVTTLNAAFKSEFEIEIALEGSYHTYSFTPGATHPETNAATVIAVLKDNPDKSTDVVAQKVRELRGQQEVAATTLAQNLDRTCIFVNLLQSILKTFFSGNTYAGHGADSFSNDADLGRL